MEKPKKSKTIIILSIILGVSIFFNLLLFFSIANLDMEWENEYNNLNSRWCEVSNDENDLVNDLLDMLGEYDPYFADLERMEQQDCWV